MEINVTIKVNGIDWEKALEIDLLAKLAAEKAVNKIAEDYRRGAMIRKAMKHEN